MTPPAPRHSRIAGLDVARAVALFGMFAAHIGNDGMNGPGGWRWLAVADGRASALFAMLAGVSIALMLSHRTGDDAVRYTRIRVAIRGLMLIVLGWTLSLLETPVDVILDNLGVMFLMACVALRWRAWVLIAVGAVILVSTREPVVELGDRLHPWAANMPVAHELWSVHYPALIWIGYVLLGMGVGKLAPWKGQAVVWLGIIGAVLAVVIYRAEPVLEERFGGSSDPWYSLYPHSYTAFETMENVGSGLWVIAMCCILAQLMPRVLQPLAATGSMTLTLYTAHIVMIAIVGPAIVTAPSNVAWVALCVVSIAFATVWKWRMGQGPLENVFTAASTAVADADARRRQGQWASA